MEFFIVLLRLTRIAVNQVRGMTFHPRPVVGAAGQAANGPPPAT
jgi:hypothetical protein